MPGGKILDVWLSMIAYCLQGAEATGKRLHRCSPLGVKGQALHPVALGFELGQHVGLHRPREVGKHGQA